MNAGRLAGLVLIAAWAGAGAVDAAERPAPARVTAVDEAHGGRVIGVLRLDGADRMTIERAVPDRQGWLADMVAEMNAKDVLTIYVPPPRAAPRFALVGKPVPRGDPRFLAALQDYLHRFYGLALR